MLAAANILNITENIYDKEKKIIPIEIRNFLNDRENATLISNIFRRLSRLSRVGKVLCNIKVRASYLKYLGVQVAPK